MPKALLAVILLTLWPTQRAAAESFTTNVLAGVYTNSAGPLVVGETGIFNHLAITQGGWLESSDGFVGHQSTADFNLVLLSDPNSRWDNTRTLYLGHAGSWNQLTASNAASLRANAIYVGYLTGSSNNVLLVRDPATTVTGTTGFILGQEGSGNQLDLQRGARLVSNTEAAIGHTRQSLANQARVTHAGTVWAHGGALTVGAYGSDANSLLVSAGGVVNCVEGTIGNGRSNLVQIADPGSAWQCLGSLEVGNLASANRLVISNGARVTSVSGYVSGHSNRVQLTGPDSVWTTGSAGSQWVFGSAGQGNLLTISQGARLEAEYGFVLGHSNEVRIAETNSLLRVRQILTFGQEFARANRLNLESGAHLYARALQVGGDQADLRLASHAILYVTNELWLGGEAGAGNHLRLEDGAQLQSGPAFLGGTDSLFNPHERNRTNAVFLEGPDTHWNVDGDLRVGATGGRSHLQISQGATLTNQTAALGYFASSTDNQAAISGDASLWYCQSNLIIGLDGSRNTLLITNAASIRSAHGALGWNRGGQNQAWISEPGSVWNNTLDLTVGGAGSSNLLVLTRGARVTSRHGYLGGHPTLPTAGRSNMVSVTGPGTVWSNQFSLWVGRTSPFNLLEIADNAEVQADSLFLGNAQSPFGNACRLRDQARLILRDPPSGSPARLEIQQAEFLISDAEVQTGQLTVQGGASHRFAFAAGLLKVRSGASWLLPFPFQVGQGHAPARFELDGTTHAFPAGLTVSSNASWQVAGHFLGPVTNAGSLVVGHPIGALNLSHPLHLTDSSELLFDIGGLQPGTQADIIRVTNSVHLAGNLRIRLTNGFIPFTVSVVTLMQFSQASGALTNAPHGARLFVDGTSNSFRVEVTDTALRLTDFQGPDALPDEDGIDDDWALAYFGHSPLTQGEKDADPDGDGQTTYQEYVANTHPLEAASVFRITSLRRNPLGQPVLSFLASSNRLYQVRHSPDLTLWHEAPDPPPTPSEPGVVEWTDPTPDTLQRRFYQLEVRLPAAGKGILLAP